MPIRIHEVYNRDGKPLIDRIDLLLCAEPFGVVSSYTPFAAPIASGRSGRLRGVRRQGYGDQPGARD